MKLLNSKEMMQVSGGTTSTYISSSNDINITVKLPLDAAASIAQNLPYETQSNLLKFVQSVKNAGLYPKQIEMEVSFSAFQSDSNSTY